MRNAILMVALVFFAASYQAVLSPPGGISSGGDTILFSNNSSNISSSSNFASKKTTIDTSYAAGEVQMEWEAFWQFYFFNSIMFFTSLLTILKLLPGVFYVRLVYLILSAIYGLSLRIISPESPISTALYLSMCAPYYLLLIIAHNLGAQWRKSRAHIGNYYVTRDHLRLWTFCNLNFYWQDPCPCWELSHFPIALRILILLLSVLKSKLQPLPINLPRQSFRQQNALECEESQTCKGWQLYSDYEQFCAISLMVVIVIFRLPLLLVVKLIRKHVLAIM